MSSDALEAARQMLHAWDAGKAAIDRDDLEAKNRAWELADDAADRLRAALAALPTGEGEELDELAARRYQTEKRRDQIHDLWIDVERTQAHLAQKLVRFAASWKGDLHDASLAVQDARASVEVLHGLLQELRDLGEAVDQHDLWAHVELTQARLSDILARLVATWKGEVHDAVFTVQEARGPVELLHDLLQKLEERGEHVDRARWTMPPLPKA